MSKITLSRFWDIGEEEIIRPTRSNLGNILSGIVLCGGKIHNYHSSDIENFEWQESAQDSSIVFRISLPIGTEEKFKKISGLDYLTEPDNAGI